MALWERVRRLAISVRLAMDETQRDRPYYQEDPANKELEAVIRMAFRDALNPYEELCESALVFVEGGEFYVPGNTEALKRLDRLRQATNRYRSVRYRDHDDSSDNEPLQKAEDFGTGL